MVALPILAGIGVFCWLLHGAAIYTLPLLIGALVGLRAEQAGAGPLGGIVLCAAAGALVLLIGRTAFAHARGPVLRMAIALVFAIPAALAGYSATSTLFGLASASEGWRQVFAIAGATAIGVIAWQRLFATHRLLATKISAPQHRRGGRADNTTRGSAPPPHWGELERYRLNADHDRGAWGAPCGIAHSEKISLSFKACGDAFRLLLSPSGEHPYLTHAVSDCSHQLAHGVAPCSLPVPRSASIHVYDGLTLAGHRLRLDRLAAMPAFNFLPLGFAHSSREPRKLPPGILRCASVLKDAASLVPGLSVAIETAMVAARKQSKENYNGEYRHVHQDRAGLHRRTRHSQPQGQERPPGRGSREQQRERANPPGFRGKGGDRSRLGQALQRGSPVPLGQARRSKLHESHLREPDRGRGRQDPHADLVSAQRPPRRRLTHAECPARPVRAGHSSHR